MSRFHDRNNEISVQGKSMLVEAYREEARIDENNGKLQAAKRLRAAADKMEWMIAQFKFSNASKKG